MRQSSWTDQFGIPLMEGTVEVKFNHLGRPALASYNIVGGKKIPGNKEFPPEYKEPTVEFEGAEFIEDGTSIALDDVPDSVEELAVQRYWDQIGDE